MKANHNGSAFVEIFGELFTNLSNNKMKANHNSSLISSSVIPTVQNIS